MTSANVCPMNLIGKTAILGAGLLGASLARALKAGKISDSVSVWSRSASTRVKCRALPEVFDEVCETPGQSVMGADLIVLCAPTANIPELAREISAFLKDGAVVSDVGSVKAGICGECAAALDGTGAVFVGSHPMAGSEKIGVDYSDEKLFAGRPCFVTPDKGEMSLAAKLLGKIWEAVGCKVYFISPAEHDAIVARVSHLPHLLAGTLCVNASKFEEADLKKFVGPGFRDTTRVASGSPEMWDSIIADNRREILAALKSYIDDLITLFFHIEKGDADAVGTHLRAAKKFRDELK